MTQLERRAWLLSGRDLLLESRNSLLLFRRPRAQRRFGSAGCSDHRVMDLGGVRLNWKLEERGQDIPASSRSGEVKYEGWRSR
jgi:hypothetical protein